jgi:stage V sporulation protein R
MLTYDEISEVAAYDGFPVRFPHWKWGMEYEELQTGYEHGMHRIYEMVVNCLAPNTMVYTQRGTLSASAVKIGDKVRIGMGKVQKVVAVVPQKKSKTKCILLKNFGQPIVCSPNHLWKVYDFNGCSWKSADELGKGDVLVGQDGFYGFHNKPYEISWSPEEIIEDTKANGHCLKEILIPKYMTVELAELMGMVIGDGSCGVKSRENMISVTVGKSFSQYKEQVISLFKRVFGEPLVESRETVDIVTYCSKIAVHLMDYLGIPKGCTYKTKRIPKAIWQSSSEYRAAFLKGLFDTDGCASSVISFSCYNKDLACDVQLMLLEMGMTSHYFEAENNDGTIHVLKICGRDSIAKFHERINFSIDYKQNLLEDLVNTGNSTNRGIKLPDAQNKLLFIGKKLGITTYNDNSVGRSLKVLEKCLVGKNILIGLCDRMILKYGNSLELQEVKNILDVPYCEVDEVVDGEAESTIDIALDTGHEFVASGLVTHNTNPCYIYCLDSNTLVDNVTVVSHALGHNDFFKNNIFFKPTSQNMMNQLANHGTRIRKYMKRWGKERVTEFIDYVLRIETLVDPVKAWSIKRIKDVVIQDTREYKHPHRLDVPDDHEYMDDYLNPKEWIKKQQDKIERAEIAKELDVFQEPTKDILGFLRDHAPLKPWQSDIVAMLYEEALYFAPQRMTKMLNEGWASYIDYNIMCRRGLASLGQQGVDGGIVEYSLHKMGVLGGKYSLNPYKLGFELFCDIQDRWDKGKFGVDYEECKDIKVKEKWDKKVGLGHDKVFEIRQCCNDLTALTEFFTEEFCNEKEFFEWRLYPNGEYRIVDRDYKSIKKKLIERYSNGGLPDIRLTDPNFKGKGYLFLQHVWTGRMLYQSYVTATLEALVGLWQNSVYLASRDKDGNEIIYCAHGPSEEDILIIPREEFDGSEY